MTEQTMMPGNGNPQHPDPIADDMVDRVSERIADRVAERVVIRLRNGTAAEPSVIDLIADRVIERLAEHPPELRKSFRYGGVRNDDEPDAETPDEQGSE